MWSDKEEARILRRAKTFMQYEIDEFEATELAYQMMLRDRPGSGDDRRVCLECANLNDNGRCRVGWKFCKDYVPLKTILWRCDYFKLKEKQ